MSSPGSLTLTLDAHARRAERAVASIALAAAAIAPWLAYDSKASALVYAACCTTVVALCLRLAGWLGGTQRIAGATWHADGRWTLIRPGQESADAVLLGGSRVCPHAVWLHWRTQERSWRRLRSMLLIASDLPPGQLRRLVVRLRLQAGRSAHSAAGAAV